MKDFILVCLTALMSCAAALESQDCSLEGQAKVQAVKFTASMPYTPVKTYFIIEAESGAVSPPVKTLLQLVGKADLLQLAKHCVCAAGPVPAAHSQRVHP